TAPADETAPAQTGGGNARSIADSLFTVKPGGAGRSTGGSVWESNPPKTGSTASHEGLKPWDGPAANHPQITGSGFSHRDRARGAQDHAPDHRAYVNPFDAEFLQQPSGTRPVYRDPQP